MPPHRAPSMKRRLGWMGGCLLYQGFCLLPCEFCTGLGKMTKTLHPLAAVAFLLLLLDCLEEVVGMIWPPTDWICLLHPYWLIPWQRTGLLYSTQVDDDGETVSYMLSWLANRTSLHPYWLIPWLWELTLASLDTSWWWWDSVLHVELTGQQDFITSLLAHTVAAYWALVSLDTSWWWWWDSVLHVELTGQQDLTGRSVCFVQVMIYFCPTHCKQEALHSCFRPAGIARE
jgi:hypothetical protein